MTKTPLIAFRCRPEALRAALEADAAKSGQSVTEIVLRALCRKYRINHGDTSMSSELFAGTPPTEPGWYWIKSFGNERPVIHEIVLGTTGDLFLSANYMDGPDSFCLNISKPLGYNARKASILYGPRVPSPEVCTKSATIAAAASLAAM